MPSGFWTELIILLSIVFFIAGVIPFIIRSKMGADKKKWFSYNHLNETHKKLDWTLRIVFLVSAIISIIFFSGHPVVLYVVFSCFIVIQTIIQAYMEWKFSINRKNYQMTLIELILINVVLIGAFFFIKLFL